LNGNNQGHTYFFTIFCLFSLNTQTETQALMYLSNPYFTLNFGKLAIWSLICFICHYLFQGLHHFDKRQRLGNVRISQMRNISGKGNIFEYILSHIVVINMNCFIFGLKSFLLPFNLILFQTYRLFYGDLIRQSSRDFVPWYACRYLSRKLWLNRDATIYIAEKYQENFDL
jgi:hypothetical protein